MGPFAFIAGSTIWLLTVVRVMGSNTFTASFALFHYISSLIHSLILIQMVFPRTFAWARFLIRSSPIASSVALCSSEGWSWVGIYVPVRQCSHCLVCLWSEGLPVDVTRL